MQKIKKNGKLVLGTSADYPPYEFHKSTNGKDEIEGSSDLVQEINKTLTKLKADKSIEKFVTDANNLVDAK